MENLVSVKTRSSYMKGIELRSYTDAAASIFINNSFIDANHSCSGLLKTTKINHGKIYEDIGSIWQ